MSYNIKELSEKLTLYGVPCVGVETQTSPRRTTYFFNLLNIKDVTTNKINRAVERLSFFKKDNFILRSGDGVSHFSIFSNEDNNPIINLSALKLPKYNASEFIAGINESGEQVNIKFSEMPHALIAGTTGSGKSVFVQNIVYSAAASNSGKNLKIAIIDKKRSLEYIKIPHLLGFAFDDIKALNILKAFQSEMYKRYEKMRVLGVENGEGYFQKWVLIIDELADLMLTNQKKEIEKTLVSLLQLSRAANITVILCTQSPRVAVITGLIQANTPTKIIFKTVSARESVLCLGHKGAEELLGNGDCIIKLPKSTKEYRIQTPFATNEEFRAALGYQN